MPVPLRKEYTIRDMLLIKVFTKCFCSSFPVIDKSFEATHQDLFKKKNVAVEELPGEKWQIF